MSSADFAGAQTLSAEQQTKQNYEEKQGDQKALFTLIQTMNVACRNLGAYPQGHPAIIESFQKVENIFLEILESRSHVTLGVAKDALMVGSKFLDRKNPVFRSFAQTLFKHGIASLSLLKGLTLQELMDFAHIIMQKRNDVAAQGGVSALITHAAIQNIQVQLIDYSVFQTREGLANDETDEAATNSSQFWGNFVQGLFHGTLDPQGTAGDRANDMDPEKLARAFNKQYKRLKAKGGKGFSFKVLQQLRDRDFQQLATDDNSTKRLSKFMTSLNDDLREQFVERFFGALAEHEESADSILSCFPDNLILDALERHTSEQQYIPPNILEILQRLNKSSRNKDLAGMNEVLQDHSHIELTEKFNVIFKEDEIDRYVPLDYQQVLKSVIKANTLSGDDLSEVEHLRETLIDQTVDINLTAIIVSIIATQGGGTISDALKQSLRDRCMRLVKEGHFEALLNLLRDVRKKTIHIQNHEQSSPDFLTEIFTHTEFIEEVLNAPERWGKHKRRLIIALVKAVGEPFATPLLNRLAEEKNRTVRQLYLDLLFALGSAVKKPVIEKLHDRRWYFVRNLVIILRELDDPSVLNALHDILGHPHGRVRQELMLTLLHFNDPLADRVLMEEMDSQDTSRCVRAIALAGKSQNEEVFQKLIVFSKKSWLSKTNFELKKAAVHALCEIGNPAAIPLLRDILTSGSLFFPNRAKRIKREIVESLVQYPFEDAQSILKDITGSWSQELGKQAALVMKNQKAKSA